MVALLEFIILLCVYTYYSLKKLNSFIRRDRTPFYHSRAFRRTDVTRPSIESSNEADQE